MKKKHVVLVVIVIITIVLSYFTGYETCDEHYKNYYDAVETMIDSIDANDMLDVIMETEKDQKKITKKKNL